MRRMHAPAALTALLAAAAMTLSACGGRSGLVSSPQDLYSLPELPAKYTELNSQLKAILDGGAEYAAPTSGTNVQPVQLTDLNGDGRDEALAFFRKADDEKPLKIYIFTADGDSYRQADLIEGSGTAVYSVSYSDLDGDGSKELAVGWRATAELQALELYALRRGGAESLLQTNYVRYAALDLDGDRQQEMVVLRADEEGRGVADYFDWQADGSIQNVSTARLSVTMAELTQQGRVTRGALRDGSAAVFVTGVTDAAATTDILAAREGGLSNLSLSEVSGVSVIIQPFAGLYPTDINGDGATETPCPAPLPAPPGEPGTCQRVDWNGYGPEGEAETVLRTYHAMEDGWYLQLPETWTGRICAARSAAQDEASVTFSVWDGGTARPFLRISALSGGNREARAMRGNRFLLSRRSNTLYTAELLEANASWEFGVTADEVRAAFSLIRTEWIAGDG